MARKTKKQAMSQKTKNALKPADPFDLLGKSLGNLRDNLRLLVPLLLLGVAFFLVMLAVVFIQGLIAFALLIAQQQIALVASLILFSLVDLIALIMMIAYYNGIQYGLMADVVSGKTPSFRRMFLHGKNLFGKMISFHVTKFLIEFIPFGILSIIVLLVYLEADGAAAIVAGLVFAGLYALLLIAFWVITIFSFPILIDRKFPGFFSGFDVIIESFNYSKANFTHVIITALIVFGLAIITWFVSTIVGMPGYVIDYVAEYSLLYDSGSALVILLSLVAYFFYLLEAIVSWLGGLVSGFFVFNSYFDRNEVKWK